MIEPASPSSTVSPQPLAARLPVEASSARTVRIAGRDVLFFGGCGYLALAHEPRVLAALSAGAARYGVSSGAARETTGNVLEHEALECEIASALEQEAALLLPEGACANLALCEALAPEFSVAFVDSDSHPSLRNAARANVTEFRDFKHNELASLRSATAAQAAEVVLLSDGVFPSAGRAAHIAELLDCLPPARGLLVIDDCHGLGVLGARGRGSLEAARLRDARVVLTGTFSKALGAYGGFVAATHEIVARVRARSATYAGTTPLPPALTCAARAALAILVGEPQRHAAYVRRVGEFRARLRTLGVPLKPLDFPVCAFELEPPLRMRRVHEYALSQGIFLPLIRYAGGGEHGYFRVVWNAAHEAADLERLSIVLAAALKLP